METAGETRMTGHALARMRQRGIHADALEDLLAYGRESFDHRGCVIVFLDKAARRRLQRERRAATTSGRGIYAVLSRTGDVVTVGHRYRRIPRS